MKLLKKNIVLIVFVGFGFFFAFFLFRFLANRASIETSGLTVSGGEKITSSSPVVSKKQPESEPEVPHVQASQSAISTFAVTVKQQVLAREDAKETRFPPLRLNGIFSHKTGNIALINDVIMREGDVILGAKVSRIYTSYVEMEMNGKTKIVRVK